MIKHLQSIYKMIGNYGCYYLAVIQLAEKITGKDIDPIETLERATLRGYVKVNFDKLDSTDAMYMSNPAGLLSYLTGQVWANARYDYPVEVKANEYEIQFWAMSKTDASNGFGHFVLADGEDTLQYSYIHKNGKQYGSRIFWRVR